jgi:hypothetical protein
MAVLTAPELLPVSPSANSNRYGLFTAANGPLDLPEHSRTGGLQYESALCVMPAGYAIACTPGTKTFGAGPTTITGNPFIVYASMTCGTVGHTGDELRSMMLARLKAGEQSIVEDVFSRGAVGQSPSLSNNTPNLGVAAGTPINAAHAVALLEKALYAVYGPLGVLHIPIQAYAHLAFRNILVKDGPVWRTQMGTPVSIGNYAGQTVAGAAPAAGHITFYITGATNVFRTSDANVFINEFGPTVNQTTNQFFLVAEREYVVTYDCIGFAIDVDLAAM